VSEENEVNGSDSPEVSAARAESLKASAEKSKAEAEKARAEARKAQIDARKAEIELARLERQERAELARDINNKIYVFDEQVNSASVEKCIQKLAEWSRTDPGCDIEILFNSPGGSVIDGMALYDYINQIKKKGHKVTCSSLGMAASMAGILLQAGDVRKMGSEAWLLIHQGSFGVVGSVGQVEDTVEWVKKIQERILDIFAAKSTLSKSQIRRRWHRKDWWLDSDEALKLGFIDEIG
jgi:ATP-dependent Clp endopeptidase proteolytic subunit ClpP